MDDVLELAEKLSQAIARSPRYRDLRKAEKAAMEDAAAMDLFKKRAEAAARIAQKEEAGQPVEPEDKRALLECEQKIRTSAILLELSRAQADFQEMMNHVNDLLRRTLEPGA
jgi:cell fate (sporulation/competence/biofilm development) regulator YlbF (YheA/YmcA/DUF963 family)